MKRLIPIVLLSLPQQALHAQTKVLPVLNQPQADLIEPASRAPRSIALATRFGTEAVDDQVVRFSSQFNDGGVPIVVDLALFSNRTPLTRTNFLSYVNSGAYTNMFMHRSIAGFVIQGGGFRWSPTGVAAIPQNAPVMNEFGVSNTVGTVAMAKLGTGPNTATNQFFFNLGDNGPNLDNQNGGFTVFAQVTRATMPNVATFANPEEFPTWNGGGALSDLPLHVSFTNAVGQSWPNYAVLYPTVSLVSMPAGQAGVSTVLTYSVVSNSNPALVNAAIQSNNLVLTYTPGSVGSSALVVRATDSVGNIVEDRFVVQVKNSFTTWRMQNFNSAELANPQISGPLADPEGDGLTNLQLFLHGLPRHLSHAPAAKFLGFFQGTQRKPRFQLPLRNDIAGVDVSVEESLTLAANSWTSIPYNTISQTTAGTVDTLTLEATPASSGAQGKRFYRLAYRLQE